MENCISIILSTISIIATVIMTIIAIKLSISLKLFRNLLLIQSYSKHQASVQGENFLLQNIIFKKKHNAFMLKGYLDIETFIDILLLSEKEKKKLKFLVKDDNISSEFGADYVNNLLKRK